MFRFVDAEIVENAVLRLLRPFLRLHQENQIVSIHEESFDTNHFESA